MDNMENELISVHDKTCTCIGDYEKKDTCKYCIDQEDIFLDDFESKVAKFKIKDVWTQTVINGSVIVPDSKDSIEQLDSINAKIKIISKKVVETPAVYNKMGAVCHSIKNEEGKISTGRKLVIEGLICLTVSYVSETKSQSVNSFEGQIPFSVFIVLPKDTCITDNYEVYSLEH